MGKTIIHSQMQEATMGDAEPQTAAFDERVPRPADRAGSGGKLELLEQRSFEQGVTMHRYAIHDVSEASA